MRLRDRIKDEKMANLKHEYIERLSVSGWKKWTDPDQQSLELCKRSFFISLYDVNACSALAQEVESRGYMVPEMRKALEEIDGR